MDLIINENIDSCVGGFIEQIENQNDYDIVILMTRKLYSLYRSYIKTPGGSLHPLIITNEAIPFYREVIKNKRVLVVDDIMIHGRTVNKVRAILSELEAADVDYRVFALSDDVRIDGVSALPGSTYRTTAVQREVQCSVRFNRLCWRTLSRKIVNRIRKSLTPLRAANCFLYVSFSHNSEDAQKWILRNFSEAKEIINSDIEHNDICTYLSVYSFEGNLTQLADVVSAVVLQFDFLHNQDEKRTILIVPHVFLKAIHEEDLECFWKELGLPYQSSTDFHVAQYRFLKYYVSHLLSKRLSQELSQSNQNDIRIDLDMTDGDYCLSPEIKEIIISEGFETRFFKALHYISWKQYQLNVNHANIMEHLYSKDKSFGENIADCGFADELLYRYQKGNRRRRIEGARICYLVEQLGLNYYEIVTSLAHSITTINHLPKSKWITERLLPGEQAYVDMFLSDPRKLIQIKDEYESAYYSSTLIEFCDGISTMLKQTIMSIEDRLMSILTAIDAGYEEEELETEPVREEFKTIFELFFSYLTEMDISSLYDLLTPTQNS